MAVHEILVNGAIFLFMKDSDGFCGVTAIAKEIYMFLVIPGKTEGHNVFLLKHFKLSRFIHTALGYFERWPSLWFVLVVVSCCAR